MLRTDILMHIIIHTRVYTHIHINTHKYMHTHEILIHAHIHHLFTSIHIYTHHTYTYHIYTLLHTHIHIYIHTCAHTQIHIQQLWSVARMDLHVGAHERLDIDSGLVLVWWCAVGANACVFVWMIEGVNKGCA